MFWNTEKLVLQLVSGVSRDFMSFKVHTFCKYWVCFVLNKLSLGLLVSGQFKEGNNQTNAHTCAHCKLGLTEAHNWHGYTHLGIGFRSQIDTHSPLAHQFLSFTPQTRKPSPASKSSSLTLLTCLARHLKIFYYLKDSAQGILQKCN